MLRSWWLNVNSMSYNASFPALCHQFLGQTDPMTEENMNNLYSLATQVGYNTQMEISEFCTRYLDVFNTGIHYSFLASIAAMLISLVIFIMTKKGLPLPQRKRLWKTSHTLPKKRLPCQKKSSSAWALSSQCSA